MHVVSDVALKHLVLGKLHLDALYMYYNGIFYGAGTSKRTKFISSKEAEACAIMHEIKLTQWKSVDPIKRYGEWDIEDLILNNLEIAESFASMNFCYIPRKHGYAARLVAKIAFNFY